MNQSRQEQKKSPKVSIGMPVYNGEKYISEAIDSLIMQTHTDFELIISDNASTDGTAAICKQYADKDSRIRFVQQTENIGSIQNFQYVLVEAVGEYFMWAAADDRRRKDFLKLALEVFENAEDCDLVFCDYELMNLDTGDSSYQHIGMFNSKKSSKNYLMRLLAPCPLIIYGLHRTSIIKGLPLQRYDFFDVHITHCYAISSIVKIIPLPLFVVGEVGENGRSPYSLTHKKINSSEFIKRERRMLFKHFDFFTASFLYFFLNYMVVKNLRSLRAVEKHNLSLSDIRTR